MQLGYGRLNGEVKYIRSHVGRCITLRKRQGGLKSRGRTPVDLLLFRKTPAVRFALKQFLSGGRPPLLLCVNV